MSKWFMGLLLLGFVLLSVSDVISTFDNQLLPKGPIADVISMLVVGSLCAIVGIFGIEYALRQK